MPSLSHTLNLNTVDCSARHEDNHLPTPTEFACQLPGDSFEHLEDASLDLSFARIDGFDCGPIHNSSSREALIRLNNALPNSATLNGSKQGFGHSFYATQPSELRQPSSQDYSLVEGILSRSRAPPIPTKPASPLRYPVLEPLVPHLTSIISLPMACDLLEFYFQSSSSAFDQHVSPYVLVSVFRKQSFLRQFKPRKCRPALLASMLWVAAQTCESASLTSPPSARGVICQKLWKLTIDLLRPLVHSPASSNEGFFPHPTGTVVHPVAHGLFGLNLTGNIHEIGNSPEPVGDLDDVATYTNLAIVVSASEYKAASLRWWNAAWSLARELKLGRELASDSTTFAGKRHSEQNRGLGGTANSTTRCASDVVSEEEREERRRIWWLLYIVDRHLALCYNRPLFLLDNECEDLFLPVDDALWQAEEFYAGMPTPKRKGLSFECTGHNIFGYFLPLMATLGDIVDLNYSRNHPRFGLRSGADWDHQEAKITQQLDTYGRSLEEFERKHIPDYINQKSPNKDAEQHISEDSASPMSSSSPPSSEWINQTRKVVAYGTHVMHTLHILLHGKWDPISLLDDDNLWICSPSFLAATCHAVSAARAVDDILQHDPDLSFMPYFFGIQLLQGSFILLLIADKLQADTNDSVIRACETIVRAHEACVVTLNTEYQRNFRKVMLSALAQIKGLGNFREHQARRREVLALYRWTGEGNGLAL